MYYAAKEKALANGRLYHLAAILRRNGKPIKIGANVSKTHPKFERVYSDGTSGAHMHAEMNVLRFARPGDEIEVMRFRKCDSELTMAKPCEYCMEHIRSSGISTVRYTNWDGDWEEMAVK